MAHTQGRRPLRHDGPSIDRRKRRHRGVGQARPMGLAELGEARVHGTRGGGCALRRWVRRHDNDLHVGGRDVGHRAQRIQDGARVRGHVCLGMHHHKMEDLRPVQQRRHLGSPVPRPPAKDGLSVLAPRLAPSPPPNQCLYLDAASVSVVQPRPSPSASASAAFDSSAARSWGYLSAQRTLP
jgi:hypothetical protein